MHDKSNVVILCYNPWSCGKFLSNILSYNKNFVPQFPFAIDEKPHGTTDIDYNQLSFDQLLAAKHDTVMRSIPPACHINNWRDYELGCTQFWGASAGSISKDLLIDKAKWILDQNVYAFIMCHEPGHLINAQKLFPRAKTIRIVNDLVINILSKKLKLGVKKPGYQNNFSKHTFENCVNFDIQSMFNQDRFFLNIHRLLTDLGVEDTCLDPKVYEYYTKYCELYKNIL